MPDQFSAAAQLLRDGVAQRAYPAAGIEVGRHSGPLWQQAFGTLTYENEGAPATLDTVFDLASLTKVIATTSLAMRAVDDGRLRVDDPVGLWLQEWRGKDRDQVTVRDLLAHCSGLSGYLPFFRDHTGRPEFEHAICTMPLEYAPRTHAIYSDLGFILLGFILEEARGRAPDSAVARSLNPDATLAAQFQRLASYLSAEPLTFHPPRLWRPRIAPTEVDEWRGRLLVGEVHDENAWALHGAAGHAGLFGTAAAVGAFARAALTTLAGERVLAQSSTFRTFTQRSLVPGSSRALGWDTMLPTSSCGTRMSPSAIGHTGFTGTSLWIDWERDLYIVLLTNRVYGGRDNQRLKVIRPAIHDAIMEALAQESG
jgi:CubicO group peptidase (beta-lactamase class C family)